MNADTVKPLHDFVLVKRVDPDANALVIQPGMREGKHTEPPRRGVVIAIGPGDIPAKLKTGRQILLDAPRLPMHVAVGDEVLYWRAPANYIEIDGAEHQFCHEEQHILAVIDR